MPYQKAVTVRAALPPDRVAEVRELLHGAGGKGTAGELFPCAEVPSVHFARVVLVSDGLGGATADMTPSVVYMGEWTGPCKRTSPISCARRATAWTGCSGTAADIR